MCFLFNSTRCFGSMLWTAWPKDSYSPVQVLFSMPGIASNVDLPAPDGPILLTNSPLAGFQIGAPMHIGDLADILYAFDR